MHGAEADGRIRVLAVDDEPNITELVAMALRYEGFEVETATTGMAALRLARRFDPHLLVLDVMLPDIDGFDLYRRLSATRAVPTIFLTARDATEDKVRGLSLGADDYLTKPFSLHELVARVHAVLRRARIGAATQQRVVAGELALEDDTRTILARGERLDLSATEYNLLRYFITNPDRVLSKREILDRVWQYDFGGDANVVETYVSYLRRKLAPHGVEPIETVRGFGYVLRTRS